MKNFSFMYQTLPLTMSNLHNMHLIQDDLGYWVKAYTASPSQPIGKGSSILKGAIGISFDSQNIILEEMQKLQTYTIDKSKSWTKMIEALQKSFKL